MVRFIVCPVRTGEVKGNHMPSSTARPRPWEDESLTVDERIQAVDDDPYLTRHVKSAITWDLILADISKH